MEEAAAPAKAKPGPVPDGKQDAELQEQIRSLRRSLRIRAGLLVAAAVGLVLAAGPAILFASHEVLLVALPLVLVIEFALGFAAAGRLTALALTQQHEELRQELAAKQDSARRELVTRWLSLNTEERTALRGRFPDLDWDMIDRMAGTEGEGSTRH